MNRIPSQSLRPADRLRKRSEFKAAYSGGSRVPGAMATLFVLPNSAGRARLGITATRRLGSAVVRNLLRRRSRDVFRRFSGRGDLPSVDIVVNLRRRAVDEDFASFRRHLETQLERLVEHRR